MAVPVTGAPFPRLEQPGENSEIKAWRMMGGVGDKVESRAVNVPYAGDARKS